MKKEISLLKDASNEIKNLRWNNERMSIRLDMFDKCILLLTAKMPQSGEGYSPDIVHAIDNFISEQKDEREPA